MLCEFIVWILVKSLWDDVLELGMFLWLFESVLDSTIKNIIHPRYPSSTSFPRVYTINPLEKSRKPVQSENSNLSGSLCGHQ